ncbi:MAG TPA: amidase [Myxococcaceae bacterium]|nr:amidase [Myxococcaceae bacterium]
MAPTSRRRFLTRSALLAGAAVVARAEEAVAAPDDAGAAPPPGSGSAAGEGVTATTIAEAEKLPEVQYSAPERAQAASSWSINFGPTIADRRRYHPLEHMVPAQLWDPRIPGAPRGPERTRLVFSRALPALPTRDEDIAYAPLTALSTWLRSRKISSVRLTELYLDRLKTLGPRLECVITLTDTLALEQARTADREIAQGRWRGPLHGVPWGAKDLLDTAGIRTTWGAEPFRNRIPATDATVVSRLHAAGAVLVAKLSLGALALNDIWFGGETKNPWLPAEGSSGSSAGSAAATAAGLVGFALASETGGSIVSPSSRCGVAGLRPTFGRVPRTGAMTLCWSLDKLGPMARSVEDTLLVLQVLSGPDGKDLGCVPSHLAFDAGQPVKGLRVGYVPAWLEKPANDWDRQSLPVDRAVVEAARRAGMTVVPVDFPQLPYAALYTVLFAEAAASFEELTLSHGVDQLKMQVFDAWPNLFRQARFLSAVDLVQADRLRRQAALAMNALLSTVDVLLVPYLRDDTLIGTNLTGHPSLTLRAGFIEVDRIRSDWLPPPGQQWPALPAKRRVPQGVTLIGRLFDEGTLVRVGMALERALGVAAERPPGF